MAEENKAPDAAPQEEGELPPQVIAQAPEQPSSAARAAALAEVTNSMASRSSVKYVMDAHKQAYFAC